MKKFISTLLSTLLFLIPCGSGCGFMDKIIKDDYEEVNAQCEKLITAMESQDKEDLRALFSKSAILLDENFELDVDSLLAYYQGELISYQKDGSNVDEVIEAGNKSKCLEVSYKITTTIEAYRLYIKYIEIDEKVSDNEGIWSLYILKQSDDTTYEEGWRYLGDGKDNPGLNVNIPNSWTLDVEL